MFPAPTRPAQSRFDGAVMEPVGGRLFFISLSDVERNLSYWRGYRAIAKQAVPLAASIGVFGPAALSTSGYLVTPGLSAVGCTL